MTTRIVIVGGGISGLALAWRLEQRLPAAEVLVLEQQGRLGGTIGTGQREGFRVERGPNGFLDNSPATGDLCRELGLGDRLVPASEAARRHRYLFLKGRLRKLPGGMLSFLFSGLLSWRAKLGLLLERYQPLRSAGEDESIDAFARRRAGAEVAETLADAFVTGIHAGDPALLSAEAALPRLVRLEREYGSVMRGMIQSRKQKRAEAIARGQPPPGPLRMWSFPEGLNLLIDTLGGRLRTPPRTGAGVNRLVRLGETGPRWEVQGDGEQRWQADAVVLTCPGPRQAEILAGLDGELARRVGEIAYNRVAVVALGYQAGDVPHRLDGFGYLSPQRSRRDVLGVQWCSSIYPGRAPAGRVLLRAMCGGWQRGEMVDWDNAELVRAVRAELRQSMGIQAEPVFQEVVRWKPAIPQYHLGHLQRVAGIEERVARHPGLFLGGNCYRGVAMNDCVEQAGVLAERVSRFEAVCQLASGAFQRPG